MPAPSEPSLVTCIPSRRPQGCPLCFSIMQMPSLDLPARIPCVSPPQPKHLPGETVARSRESLFTEQVDISGMRLKSKSPVPNPGNSRLPAQGRIPGLCNPWPSTAIAARRRAKSCAGQNPRGLPRGFPGRAACPGPNHESPWLLGGGSDSCSAPAARKGVSAG